ncbi:MAG: ExbD/TolR family protein [Roseinatronobacter sp.]
MFRFAAPRPTRRPSLTPMIDVVFLLLVFFMLAARFGQDVGLALATAGGVGTEYQGPPRLVEFDDSSLWLNGAEINRDALPDAVLGLMPSEDAIVVLRPRDGARVQELTDVTEFLQAAGVHNLVLLEP